jgi:hypothetical protein
MAYPIRTCVACGEEFELRPGKPGFANRCPGCSEDPAGASEKPAGTGGGDAGLNEARRRAIRDLLYRKE